MATLRRSPIFRMLMAVSMGSIALTTLVPGLALGLPLVAITRPTQGATVTGVIWIDVAFRSDSNRPITRLEVYIDDQLAREVDLATPMLEGRQSFNWDFSYAAATTHKIAARAIDSANAAAAASISVQVANAAVAGPDRIPPVVRIYYPAQGAKLHGQVEVKAEASDNVGVELVYFYIDGRLHKMMMNAPPYVDSWDTTREADGNHVVEALAVDAQENEARSAQVTVIVENANMTLQNTGGMKAQGTGPQVGSVLPTAPQPLSTTATQPGGLTWQSQPQPVATAPVPQPIVAGAQPQWNAAAPSVTLPTPAPTINPVAPAPTPIAAVPSPSDPAASKPIGQVFQNAQVTPTPIPAATDTQSAKVRDVDPLLSLTGPKVAVIVPKAQAAGPVPGAPLTVAPLLPLGDPQSLTTARTEGLVAAPAPTTTPRTTSASLPKPGTQTTLPTAAAGSFNSPKVVAPTLTREPSTIGTGTQLAVAPTQTPTWEAVPVMPAPAHAAAPRRVPASANSGLIATLSPANVASPELAPASRPNVVVAKSLAPVSTMAVHGTSRISSPGAVSTVAAGTPTQSAGVRSSLATMAAKPAPSAMTVVTAVGPPVAATIAALPVEMQPVTNVVPDHKFAPAGLSRLTTPAPTKAVASVKPTTSKPATQVAAVTRPALSPAVLTQAVLAEYRGLPVPASRMLAMLPSSEAGKLSADGKITAPGNLSAAVPVAVQVVRDIKIVFDGEVLSLRTAPETRLGISLAPLREIFEKTDGVLYWFPTERKVQAVNKGVDLRLKIGDPKITVNGQSETLQIAPYIKQGRTMVPLQFIADVLDVKIAFDNSTGQILISSNQF